MTARAGLRVVIALAAVVVAAGALSLGRPGYSPDEEFTVFAVRGIRAHGLPLLPSGLLYDRGLAYSYTSWAAAEMTGVEFPAFRALGLLAGAAALVLGFVAVRRVASPAAGAAAAGLVATSVPFWAAATTGRFYAPFLLTWVGILLALTSGAWHVNANVRPRPLLRWLAIFALAFVSRLTHELAFTLMAIPAAGLVVAWAGHTADRNTRREWLIAAMVIAAGLASAQAVLMGLHFLLPPTDGGGTMIRRFFLWQVLNLFERPTGAPLGVVLAAATVGVLVTPARAGRTLRLAAIGTAAVLGILVGYDIAAGPTHAGGLGDAFHRSLAYPLDMFWHLGDAHPWMVGAALGLMLARSCGAGGAWPAGERAAHLGWVGWVLWFGVIDSGITVNYLLMPTTCLLAAIGIDLVAIGQHTGAIWPGRAAQVARAGLVAIAVVIAADQWSGTGSLANRLAAARPTIDVAGLDSVRAALRPEDRVACTDELACLLLVGRLDAWLALDPFVRERFVVSRGTARVGVYAGAPAITTPGDLFSPEAGGIAPARVVVVDVFKEFPVGNSRAWLPRALEADGLGVRAWLETPQARVVEITRPGSPQSR